MATGRGRLVRLTRPCSSASGQDVWQKGVRRTSQRVRPGPFVASSTNPDGHGVVRSSPDKNRRRYVAVHPPTRATARWIVFFLIDPQYRKAIVPAGDHHHGAPKRGQNVAVFRARLDSTTPSRARAMHSSPTRRLRGSIPTGTRQLCSPAIATNGSAWDCRPIVRPDPQPGSGGGMWLLGLAGCVTENSLMRIAQNNSLMRRLR